MAATAVLECNNVVIRKGRVQRVEHWAMLEGDLLRVVAIQRRRMDRFRAEIANPQHGAGPQVGTFEKVTETLNPAFQAGLRALFGLSVATESVVHGLHGFEDHTVVVQ